MEDGLNPTQWETGREDTTGGDDDIAGDNATGKKDNKGHNEAHGEECFRY